MPVQNVQYKLLQKYPNYYWWANLITLVWSFNGLMVYILMVYNVF